MKKDYQIVLSEKQIIEGERIILRPVSLDDAESMYAYTQDEKTVQYVTMSKQESIEETKSGIASFFLANPLGKYGIVLKESNKFIGTIDIRVSEENQNAELGYMMNSLYTGNGYMTEAGKLLLWLGFDILELNSIFSRHDIANPASGRVMERLGMTKDGILRQNTNNKGEIIDMAYYSILRSEYVIK